MTRHSATRLFGRSSDTTVLGSGFIDSESNSWTTSHPPGLSAAMIRSRARSRSGRCSRCRMLMGVVELFQRAEALLGLAGPVVEDVFGHAVPPDGQDRRERMPAAVNTLRPR
jgi:hypothetical protein